jgi:hypothetical protein
MSEVKQILSNHPLSKVLPLSIAGIIYNSLSLCDLWGCHARGEVVSEQRGPHYDTEGRNRCVDLIWDRCPKHVFLCSEFRSQEHRKDNNTHMLLCDRVTNIDCVDLGIDGARDDGIIEQVDGYTQWYCSKKHWTTHGYGDDRGQ